MSIQTSLEMPAVGEVFAPARLQTCTTRAMHVVTPNQATNLERRSG
jgi:hypothetical protein